MLLSALKIFAGFDESSLQDRNLSLHHLIQATRFGYAQRSNYGDPRFVSNVTKLEQLYRSTAVTDQLRAKIRNVTEPASYYAPSGYTSLRESGTSAIVAVRSCFRWLV